MTGTIYKVLEPTDLNPEMRSWQYDECGNRVDKKSGAYVIIVPQNVSDTNAKELLSE